MFYPFNYYEPPAQDPPNFCAFCEKEIPENKIYCSSSCLINDSEL